MRSYTARVINTARTKNTVREAAGIWKPPIDLFIVNACSTEKVSICAYVVQNKIVVAQIGSSRIIAFTSSTLVTEQIFHGLQSKTPSFT